MGTRMGVLLLGARMMYDAVNKKRVEVDSWMTRTVIVMRSSMAMMWSSRRMRCCRLPQHNEKEGGGLHTSDKLIRHLAKLIVSCFSFMILAKFTSSVVKTNCFGNNR